MLDIINVQCYLYVLVHPSVFRGRFGVLVWMSAHVSLSSTRGSLEFSVKVRWNILNAMRFSTLASENYCGV